MTHFGLPKYFTHPLTESFDYASTAHNTVTSDQTQTSNYTSLPPGCWDSNFQMMQPWNFKIGLILSFLQTPFIILISLKSKNAYFNVSWKFVNYDYYYNDFRKNPILIMNLIVIWRVY